MESQIRDALKQKHKKAQYFLTHNPLYHMHILSVQKRRITQSVFLLDIRISNPAFWKSYTQVIDIRACLCKMFAKQKH